MYCSDETLKDHTKENISRSEKSLTKITSLQIQRFDELKPTPQEEPVDIQQDQVLPGDSWIFAKTIPESSSVTSTSIINNVEIQQLPNPSEKPHERMTDSCKISLPDPTVLTKVGNILLTRNQSQDLEDHEDQKLLSNFPISETPPEKSSLMWLEEKGVEQTSFGRSNKKTVTKVHQEFTMPTTPTHSHVTDMALSRGQHLSVEVKGGNVTESSDSFRKSNKSIIIGSHEEVPLSDPTTVIKTSDIYLNQSQILLDQAQAQQSPTFSTKVSTSAAESTEKSKPCLEVPGFSISTTDISLPKSTDVPELTGIINPQLTKGELEAEDEDTTRSSNKSFMKSFALKGEGEFCNETLENHFTKKSSSKTLSFDDNKHTPHEDSLEAQQHKELSSNTLPFEFTSERVTKAIVRGVDIEQKTISSRKPSDSITDTLQITLPDHTVYTEVREPLLTKDQPQGLEVQQDQKLPSDSLIFETPLVKSSTVRAVDIQKPLTPRSSKNTGTQEDVSLPAVIALTHVTSMLSAQDQTQLVEAKQDQSLPHDVLIADAKGNKFQCIMIGSYDKVPLSDPSTTKFPTFSAESIAIKPVLDKTAISICTSFKKLVSLPTSPDVPVQRENTKCQMTGAQMEVGDLESIKILSETSILKPYTLERSGLFLKEGSENVVAKTSLQTQGFSDHKHILQEYPLEGQHDQNLLSNATLFEITPERTSLTSDELQQQSIVSDKPSVRLVRSPEITLPDPHTNETNIFLARDQPQGLEAQQDKKPPSEKSVIWPPSVVRGVDLKLPLTFSSMSSENIAIEAHEDISLSNLPALTHVPVIPSAREQTHLLTEAEQDENKQHGCFISDVNVGQVPELSTPLGKSSKNIISSHEELSLSHPTMVTKNNDVFLSRNLNQEQTQTLGLSFSTSPIDRVSLLARSTDVPVKRESTTSPVEEAQVNAEDVGTIQSSLKQKSLERTGIVSESSEFTKKPSLQTQKFDYHKHTGHDYPLKNEQNQQLPSNVPVLELTDEIPLGTWSKSVVVGVDVQQKSVPSGKPSEKNESSFEDASPDSTVHTMVTGISLSRDQHILEKLPSDSLLFEKTLEKSSFIWSKSVVSDAEIQQPSLSSQKPNEHIIDPHKVRFQNPILLTEVTDLTRDQAHVPLEDEQIQMLSNDTFVSETMYDSSSMMESKSVEVQQPSALSERSSSHKEATLLDSTISQNQDESMKFTLPYQDTQIKYPYPSITLYPGTSPDYLEISDTSSKPLQSTNTVQCTVESPTMLLTLPSPKGEETALEESSVIQCQCVTQELNNLNLKTNEMAKFVCCIDPQTLSNAVWYHNDKRLATTERIKFEQSGSTLSLLIYDIQPEDQGIYTCVVKNKDGKTQTTSAQLNIEGGYFPCNHLILNHHSRNIHIIPCHFAFMSNPDDLP